MTQQLLERTHRETRTPSQGDTSGQSSSTALMGQASAWAGVARQARESCETHADAVRELERRQNTSGQ